MANKVFNVRFLAFFSATWTLLQGNVSTLLCVSLTVEVVKGKRMSKTYRYHFLVLE